MLAAQVLPGRFVLFRGTYLAWGWLLVFSIAVCARVFEIQFMRNPQFVNDCSNPTKRTPKFGHHFDAMYFMRQIKHLD